MKLLKCLDIASELATVNRYSKSRLLNQESVLEHTGFVSMICYFIGTSCNQNEENCIDIGVLLSKCIVHDMDEYITGDVIRPTKYSSPEMSNLFEKLAESSMEKVSLITENNKVLEDWITSKSGKEGCIVAFADCFSVVYKAYDEVYLRGNKTIDFGGVIGLRETVNKRIHEMDINNLPKIVTSNLYDSCSILLGKVYEALK